MKDRRPRLLLVSILANIVLLLVSYRISQSQYIQFEPPVFNGPTAIIPPTETRLAKCVSYPSVGKDSLVRTVTPYPRMKSNDSLSITVTPLPIANIIDLSPKAKASDKAIIIIFRCNGTFDQFIIGPDIKIPEGLPLGIGDTVYDSMPLSIHPMQPNRPIETSTPPILTNVPIGTINPSVQPSTAPYPAPNATSANNPDKNSPTSNPYPAP